MITNSSNNPASPDFLKLLLDNSHEIILIIDSTLQIVIFNKAASEAAVEFLKKPLKEGDSILQYAQPERVEALKLMYASILKGESRSYKYPFTDKKIYSFDFRPVYDGPEVKYITLTCKDITNEETALQQLSSNQELLKHAESIAGLGSWEWDIPTDKITWSDELYRLLGLNPGEHIPSKELGFSFLHPDDVSIAEETLLNCFKSGAPFNQEIRLKHTDGALKYVYCQGIVVRNKMGRNEKVIGTFHDITDKKLLEESIHKQEQRFQSLIESSADMIIQVNEKREIIYASPSIHTIMQYSPDEICGLRIAAMACPEDLPGMLKEFEKILQQPGVPHVLQYRVVKKDGTFLWVEGTVTNLLHIAGVNSVVINQRDISQRKEAERLLNQLNETLELRAVELSSSNIELERFAYVASHDLQEPLRMVTSFLQLLSSKYKEQLDERAQQYIHYAVDGAARMKQLINDLLDYSRAGSKRGMFTTLNMNEIMMEVSHIFKDQLEATGGTVIADNLFDIVAERTQMIQLFQNLVGNAIKYRSSAPLVIRIDGTENDSEWIISIKDNGLGVPEKFSEEIFNIFQRLHSKNEYEGTGIGLAICKKIVETHGGKIWVTPAEEQGSIFSFSIKKPSVSGIQL